MYRIVLDTNVLISAYGFGGKPLRLLEEGVSGGFRVVTSVPLMTELARNLYGVLGWTDEYVTPALAQIARVADIVEPEVTLHIIEDDADNRVLECALAGGAELIATGDKHLLRLGEHEGVRIVRPAEALCFVLEGG